MQIVCATGFRRGFEHDSLLLRGLVEEHGLETEERWIVLAPDATTRAQDSTRTLALAEHPLSGRIPLPTHWSA